MADSQQVAEQGAGELPEAEGDSLGGCPQKRPRVDKVGPSDVLPEIIPRPSDPLQEVSGSSLLLHSLSLSFFLMRWCLLEARIYMHEVKEGLNRMLNMIREETEESMAAAWKRLEAERDCLHEL